MSKRGRPIKPRSFIERIAPAAVGRELELAAAQGRDSKYATVIGRFWAANRITTTQLATAYRAGEIYGAYECMEGIVRSSRSPSYEVGYGGGGGLIEGANDEQVKKAWDDLQGQIPKQPRHLKAEFERLVVEDRFIGPIELNEVCDLLDKLAVFFGIARVSGKNRPPKLRPIVKQKEASPPPRAKTSYSKIDRDALCAVLLRVNEFLQPHEIDREIEFFFTFRDRERFRAEKERANS